MKQLAAAALAVLGACSGEGERGAPAPATSGPLSVCAVSYPLAYFAERIGGELVRVEFPAPADVDPAFWSPPREVVARVQQADLVLSNGAGFARWVDQASLPLAALVDTSRGFAEDLIALEGEVAHSHGPAGEHSHAGTAFTTWLDPRLAQLQAREILAALERALPAHAAELRERSALLEHDLGELDRELETLRGPATRTPLLASHPVYQYLARASGLELRSLHWEPNELPDEAAWAELEALLALHPARIMLWEAEPLPATAERLATSGIAVAVFEPCGNRPARGDYFTVQRENVRRLAAALAANEG